MSSSAPLLLDSSEEDGQTVVSLQLPVDFEQDAQLPDLTAGTPDEIWTRYFSKHRPAPAIVRRWITKLHQERQHAQVVACLRAALIHGQSQPWMYEVLALSMEICDAPKTEIERVVLSMTDFGSVDYESMMYSGAYLNRLQRPAAALRLYQQASRIAPERPEPYLLGLKLAQSQGGPGDVEWAAVGVLSHCWGADHVRQQQQAEDALRETARRLRQKREMDAAQQLEVTLAQARQVDLSIRIDWTGDADLDLFVEEPGGSVCSFETPATPAGGIFLHDGVGPDPQRAYEAYVAPQAFPGAYRIVVKNAFGKVVGDRANLTITLHRGAEQESKMTRVLDLRGGEATQTVDLPDGRRAAPRNISQLPAPEPLVLTAPRAGGPRDPAGAAAARDFAQSRAHLAQQPTRRAGAVGYAPVTQTIPQGASLGGLANISADRRYVRLSIQPSFSQVTDVFTFSFINGAGTGRVNGR